MKRPATLFVSLALLGAGLCVLPVSAQSDRPTISEDMVSGGFLSAHPDLRFRSSGMNAYDSGRFLDAAEQFRAGSRFADKPSQAMLAQMFWSGQGVVADRVQGYIWMDLAAERMWRPFLVRREWMWQQLTPAERERALVDGKAVFAEFGDEVAKPRKEAALRKGRRNVTGSRVGAVGALSVQVPGPGGLPITIRGDEFYNPVFWDTDKYWAWQEDTWKDAPPGLVEVGALENETETSDQ